LWKAAGLSTQRLTVVLSGEDRNTPDGGKDTHAPSLQLSIFSGEKVRLLILGAGGLAKEVADVARRLGHEISGFFEEGKEEPRLLQGVPVLSEIPPSGHDGIVVGVGDTALRRRFYETYAVQYPCPALIDPSAIVSPFASIGDATVVMQGCVVNADAVIGRDVLVNVGCCVAHDCEIGDHVHLAPAVMLGGRCSIGAGALCGTGAVVLPDRSVGAWSVCGAGAVVTRNVPQGAIAHGIPARVAGGRSAEA
jgi:sugar O-acyltransferase (sialic acid O-acetyltransferase NeuD family)